MESDRVLPRQTQASFDGDILHPLRFKGPSSPWTTGSKGQMPLFPEPETKGRLKRQDERHAHRKGFVQRFVVKRRHAKHGPGASAEQRDAKQRAL